MPKEKASLFNRLIITIALLLVFILLSRTPADADMWWHLRSGEEMVTQGEILLEDIFSYTRYGADWVNAFWLSDVLIYLVFKVGEYFALASFVSLMAVATFGIAAKQMRGPAFLRALLLLLAALVAAPIWSPRPQLFSFLFLAILDYWLSTLKKNEKARLWLLIPFFILWANLHGGYVWGILLLIATLAGELINKWMGKEDVLPAKTHKNLLLFTFLAFFAVLLNPSGFELWRLPFHTLDVSLSIQEWQSPNFHQISFHPMLWMLFLLILVLANTGRKLGFSDLFKVLGFTYMTFVSQRNVAPFAIILLPVLSREFSSFWNEEIALRLVQLARGSKASSTPQELPLKLTRFINGILISFILFAAFGNLYFLTRPEKVDALYPRAAVQWIEENQPEGALLNSYNWGGYLIWNLREYPVFIDGRADLYGAEMIDQWKQVTKGGEAAQQILDEWDVNLILLEPGWAVGNELSEQGWELLYEDDISVVYGR
ncbi:MAG: hypothetical protein HN390_04295 [Anaerolineae bacterium]|nr:hypothetical protein [Anaerolineae bacterium]MBT7189467.1 hypothetical protein [Anaerolineae bacterium]